MNTTESNKLIAEFMGVEPTSTKHTKHWYGGQELKNAGLPFSPGAHGNGTDDPKFLTSWDWLMPVVEKIEKLQYPVIIEETYCTVNLMGQSKTGLNIDIGGGDYTKLSATYEAVVKFIQWYNENK